VSYRHRKTSGLHGMQAACIEPTVGNRTDAKDGPR
jgi:hypothetical protein